MGEYPVREDIGPNRSSLQDVSYGYHGHEIVGK